MGDAIHDLLDEHGIDYEVHEHPRAVTASRLAEAEDVSGWDVAKPVLVSVGGELAMLVVPGPVYVDLDKASDVLGHNEVSLAGEGEFAARFPDAETGAEAPFGSPYDIPVFLDEQLRARERMVCRDSSHTRTITLAMADYISVEQPEIVDIATGGD